MERLEGDTVAGVRPARWALLAALAAPLLYVPGLPFAWTFPGAVWARPWVAAAALCGAWAVFRGGAGLRPPRDPFALALLPALAVAVASALLGAAPSRSLFGNLERMGGVVGTAHVAAWYLLLRTVLDDAGWRSVLRGLALVAGAAGLLATVQWVGAGGPPFRGHAPLGNPGPLGGLLAVGICAAAASAGRAEPGDRWRWAAAAAGAAALAGLAAAGTRAAMGGLALGAAAGGGAWLLRSRGIRAERLAPWLAGAAVAGAAALVALAGISAERTPSDAAPVEAQSLAELRADRTLGMRLDAWGAAAEGVRERPLAGWGPENFRIVFDRHGPAVRSERITQALSYDRAHDFFVEAAAAGGLPGLLAAMLVAFAALWAALAAALDPSATEPAEGAALAAGVVAYGGFLLFWYRDPAAAPAALVLVGLAAHRLEGRRWLAPGGEEKTVGVAAGRAAAAAVAAVALAAAVHAALLVPPARAVWRADVASDARTKFGLYDRAVATRVPGAEETVARYAGAVSSLLPRARALAADPGAESTLDAAFASVRRSLSEQIDRDPENAQLRALRSRVLLTEARWRGDRGLAEEATAAMAEAVERAPAHLIYRYALSEMLRVTGRPEASVEVLRRALEVAPSVDATRVHLARAFTRTGRPDSAADHLLEGRSAVRTPADTVLMRRLLAELAGEQGGARVRGLQQLLADTRSELQAADGGGGS